MQTLSPTQSTGTIEVMLSRSEAVAQSLASARLEGMEPSAETVERLQEWGRGELTDADLEANIKQLLAAARDDGAAVVRAAA